MKISYNWLKQYLNFDYSPQQLADVLTNTGLEVEKIEEFESIPGGLEGVVVGKVLSCEKRPNANNLSVTTVDVGAEEPLTIVCGAPNVEKDQKVLVATPGTTLYPEGDKPFAVKKTKIRGETSNGMICAEDELGLGSSHEGIIVLEDDKEIGKPASEYFHVEKDWTFEIDLTPNRVDATSHIGVARDVLAVINRMSPGANAVLEFPSVDNFEVESDDLHIPVEIQDELACPRYSALTLEGITVTDSPQWFQNRIEAAGLRPVNNIVDITNFVMLETGQPLHSFDADEIKGNKVVIKKMEEGTPFTTLDGINRKLSGEDLMICNEYEPMCIAGVFGGADSGVTSETKDIFLESAYFEPTSIRNTSKRHQLKTEASFRFERGADPNMTLFALKRAAGLLREIGGGKVSSPVLDENPGNITPWQVDLSFDNLERLTGIKINHEVAKKILQDLGIEIMEQRSDGLKLSVSTFKVDVKREVDVIEEILRIYGFNHIPLPERMQISLSYSSHPDKDKITNLISDFLSDNGFAETMNNSLTASAYSEYTDQIGEDNHVSLINPLSRELNVMRQDLLTGGLETIKYNINRQTSDMMFYETGKIYKFNPGLDKNEDVTKRYNEDFHLGIFLTGRRKKEKWNTTNDKVDFYDLKHWVNLVLKRLGIEADSMRIEQSSRDYFTEGLKYSRKKQEVAHFGKLSSRLLKKFDIEQDVYYADLFWDQIVQMTKETEITHQPLPKYPEVRRDLALLLDKDVKFESIRKLAFEKERKILKEVNLFDVYEGDNLPEGKKSYAVSFVLQDPEKTLTDKLIDKTMKKLQQTFEQKLNAEIRG